MGCGNSTQENPTPEQSTTAPQSEQFHDGIGGLFPVLQRTKSREEKSIAELFSKLDEDGSGYLEAGELLSVLETMKIRDLTEDDCADLVRDFDGSGDGKIELQEFAAILSCKEPPTPRQPQDAHLELHFDINKTVDMFEPETGLSTKECCNHVLGNAVWGRVSDEDSTKEPLWECVSDGPSLKAPRQGLQTYAQYLALLCQRAAGSDSKQTRKRCKDLAAAFTEQGEPGEAFQAHRAKLEASLVYSKEVTGSEEARAIGISENVQLLTSFFELLRKLKIDGRSFSVCFRSFGTDLIHMEKEYNSFCEGRHPAFVGKANQVKLDGSDGGPDMRLRLTADGHGTWVRDISGSLQLVLGTIEQPNLGDDINEFYDTKGPNIKRLTEVTAARDYLHGKLGSPCALALRDYYPGWAAKRKTAEGGKVLFLDDDGSNSRLQLFFDDQILPADAHIVDVRWASQPTAPAVTMSSLYNRHLVRAEPLNSITDNDYFYKSVAQCQDAWRAALQRKYKLATALRDYQEVANAIANKSDAKTHTPYQQTTLVTMTSNVNTFGEEDDYNAAWATF